MNQCMKSDRPDPSAKIAVITRTKNRPLFLARCIRTVLEQTESDWIHVIVNDGGDPAPVEAAVRQHADRYRNRVQVVHNEISLGMEAASNVGIKASDSRYVVILDDDDSWDPRFLEVMTAHLEGNTWPHLGGCFCHTKIIYEEIRGDSIVETGRGDFNSWISYLDFFQLLPANRFTPVCFVFERAALDQVGLFDESLPVCGDWEFNLRFLSHYDIDTIPMELAFWHQRPTVKDVNGNSITAGADIHALYRARIINRWVRDGLKQKATGMADLFAAAISFEQAMIMQRKMERKRGLSRLNRKLKSWLKGR